MKRELTINPGYDCRKECLHEKKGEHGIACDSWWYSVTDHTRAVSLEVFSGNYPPTVDRSTLTDRLRRPWGAQLTFHQASNTGRPCTLVAGGLCESDVSFLQADEFWREHGDPKQPEQGEAFWLALEARLPE